MITSHIRRNKDGVPVWTIRVTGTTAIFRYAYYKAHGPVDYLDDAKRAFRYVRRVIGREAFAALDKGLTNGVVGQHGWASRRRGF